MNCPKRSAVTGLPEDSLVEILARVPARTLYRSKCVAKAWRDLIEDPLHRKKLPQTLQGFFFIDRLHNGFTGVPARSAHLQINPSLYFLTELHPRFETLTFSDSSNGLLLFEHKHKSWPSDRLLDYVVCNPATKQWEVVPRCGPPPPEHVREPKRYNYLVFDPSISSHFHLVQFMWEFRHLFDGFVVEDDDEEEDDGDEENDGYVPNYWGHLQQNENDSYVHNFWGRHHQHFTDDEEEEELEERSREEDGDEDEESEGEIMGEISGTSVRVYSSETGKWTHMQSDWIQTQIDQGECDLEGWHHQGLVPCQSSWCAFLNGMLHFMIKGKNQIAAVDVQGATRKIIQVPTMVESKSWRVPGYVTKSQGCLHYINQTSDAEQFIWVLEDYDAQSWVLKRSMSFMELFGKKSRTGRKDDYSVVAMHPDGNVVFIVEYWSLKLISYDMDHKLVTVIGTLKSDPSIMHVVPYVPCFSESLALTNK